MLIVDVHMCAEQVLVKPEVSDVPERDKARAAEYAPCDAPPYGAPPYGAPPLWCTTF